MFGRQVRGNQTGDPVFDKAARCGDPIGDQDRPAAEHGFIHRPPPGFMAGGEDRQIGGKIVGRGVEARNIPRKAETAGNQCRLGLGLEPFHHRAGAGHDKLEIGKMRLRPRHQTDHQIRPLHPTMLGEVQDNRIVAAPPLATSELGRQRNLARLPGLGDEVGAVDRERHHIAIGLGDARGLQHLQTEVAPEMMGVEQSEHDGPDQSPDPGDRIGAGIDQVAEQAAMDHPDAAGPGFQQNPQGTGP